MVEDLAALDMLRSVDSSALAAYCQSYARWQSAESIVDREGQTVNEPVISNGEVVGQRVKRQSCYLRLQRMPLAAMLRASSLFGFDPSSRSRINLGDGEKETDPFAEFMSDMSAEEVTQ